MRLTNKTDIFFDLDHTLWDFEKNSELAFGTIFEKHNISISLADFLAFYVPINLQYWKLYREDKISQSVLRYKRLKDVFDSVNYPVSDELIELVSSEYIHYLPRFNHLFDGAIEVLDYLKPKYRLHIITNGFHDVQFGKLKNSNIEHYFSTVTNSEMAGVKKPNPKIFEFALNLAQTNPSKSVMIGDSFEADIEGALNFGLDAVFFNEQKVVVDDSVRQIQHLNEIKNIL